jgi:hypothetical protein
MNLNNRIERLEDAVLPDSDSCVCEDALALMGTEHAKTCFKCGRAIDLGTWKNWRLIQPTAETNFFAFCLLRDDNLSDGM